MTKVGLPAVLHPPPPLLFPLLPYPFEARLERMEMGQDEVTPGQVPGGGYSRILPIRVFAAQRGRDFEAPDLERGIHFRGVF